MYGELMWRPWELMEATFKDVSLAIYGLREKDYWLESILRRVAAGVVSSGNNAKLAKGFNRFWPDSRPKKGTSVFDPDSPQMKQLRRFKEMEAEQKINNAGGT